MFFFLVKQNIYINTMYTKTRYNVLRARILNANNTVKFCNIMFVNMKNAKSKTSGGIRRYSFFAIWFQQISTVFKVIFSTSLKVIVFYIILTKCVDSRLFIFLIISNSVVKKRASDFTVVELVGPPLVFHIFKIN